MPNYLIHHDGAWNEYSTVSDAPRWTHAIPIDRMRRYHREVYGVSEQVFEPRVQRALNTGCSCVDEVSLDDCIRGNRAGPNETELSREEFIARYLTLP